jgi:hypothetical protein
VVLIPGINAASVVMLGLNRVMLLQLNVVVVVTKPRDTGCAKSPPLLVTAAGSDALLYWNCSDKYEELNIAEFVSTAATFVARTATRRITLATNVRRSAVREVILRPG